MADSDLVLVGQRGTITIPKRVRVDLGIGEGSRLRTRVENGALVLRPVRGVADRAVDARRLLEATNEAYARLRADKGAWEELLRERAEWDVTLMDGLDGDDVSADA